MRSETSEVETGGPRSRNTGVARAAASAVRKMRLRKLAIEPLEERALMAVLPAVNPVGTLSTIIQSDSHSNASAPTIVIDPINPRKLAAIWQVDVDNNGNYSQFTQAATSADGGQSWRTFYFSNPDGDPTSTTGAVLPMTTDPTIAIDRNEQIYVLDRAHKADNSVGFLDLHRFSFSGNTASSLGPRIVVAAWNATENIYQPTLVVDTNEPTFTDTTDAGVTHTVVDPNVNNVYIAWVTGASGVSGITADVQPRNIPTPEANRVILVGSSDGGSTFSPWTTVDDRQFTAKNAAPKLVVSQGTFDQESGFPRVSPGQVSVVWDDFGSAATASPPFDILRSDRGVGSVAAATFNAATGPIGDNTSTDFPIAVNLTDPDFTTLSNLSVSLQLTHPNLDQLTIQLVPPTGSNLPTTTLSQFLPAGANMGAFYLQTTFDDQAILSINDANTAAPYLGHFRPTFGVLSANYAGATAAQLNGQWSLRIIDNAANNGAVQFISRASVAMTSGMVMGSDRTITTTLIRGNLAGSASPVYPTASAATPNGIGPGLQIASDNTLGSFSPYQGRLYVAYVTRINANGNPADNTDVSLSHSDDGGLTWVSDGIVNDDDAFADGYTEGGTVLTGRPQFMPSIAVDQATGTLVYSYRDARNDAARARVATYVTTSIDGGQTFAVSNFLNAPKTATDAITGQVVSNGPIPDNQSASNGFRDTIYGYGTHDALAVSNGVIYASWGSNVLFSGGAAYTGGRNGQSKENIALGIGHIAAGPRIISSTMGPVGLTDQFGNTIDNVNTLRTSDGTPIANAFIVTFDRPIDPSTFSTNDVQVFFRDTTPNNISGGPVPVTNVTPLDLNDDGPFPTGPNAPGTGFGPAHAEGATRFRVNFAPRSAVGTYSYTVGPNINDRIRGVKAVVQPTGAPLTFNPAPNQIGLAVPPSGSGGTGIPALDTTVSQNVVNTGNPADVVAKVTVHVNITHTFTGDLTLTLVSPGGTRVVLAQQLGGGTDNGYANTTFSDTAATSIDNANAPFNGTFKPEGALAVFNGQNANGTWSLEVNDGFGGDVGTLVNWSLQITPGQVLTNGSPGNLMDQNADALPGQSPSDLYAAPTPLGAVSGVGQPPQGPYDPNTLPLIVTGPYVVSSNVAGNAQTGDNLVLNNTVSAIDLTFDRDMDIGTFTAADVLRIQGPAGVVPGPYSVAAVYNQNGSLPLNDNGVNNGVTTSTLTVPNNGAPFTIADLNVQVNISHAHVSELTLTLIAPDGTRVPLAMNVGGTAGKNFNDTVFDDDAALSINSGLAPFNGSFRPASGLDAALAGKQLSGNWKLEIVDNAAGNVGTLKSWSLAATPSGIAYARAFRVSFPQQQLSGTYVVTLGPNILSRNGDAIDNNHNAGVALLTGAAAPGGTTVPVTYNSTDVPQSILDNKTTDSTITVGDNYLIAGTTLTLSINHPFDPDLVATLIAPDGTRVTLFTSVGAGITPSNFQATTFDDAAATPIQNGGAPFFGTFNPQQPLSQLNGKNVNGTWTLEIQDVNGNGLTGSLVSWSLKFQKPMNSSGLGEAVADQTSASFRIFTLDPTNTLASSTWTAVGPAANNNQGNSGIIGGMAVDPSDPSGNTVYIGGATGGIWKTTNFLTTDPNGPTYIPLTDFGPTFGLNIGSIAIYGRNNDPSQSIIFATTGFGDTNSGGAGIIRSMDGGATWQLLDSLNNVDGNGNPLPFSQRTHEFVGKTSFKIVVDPTPGSPIVYATFAGANGGVYRSLDTGKTWQLMRAGDVTDIVLDLNSGTGSVGGNLQIVYAAFRGDGVYMSPNRGQVWNLMAGGVGNPLIRDNDIATEPPVPVQNTAGVSPNGAQGRIVLARPALTGNAIQDVQYQGWLYALVATSGKLYLTKDFGQNWTQVHLPDLKIQGLHVPSNNATANTDYDIANGGGEYDLSIAVDPNNPQIVYLGGNGAQFTGLLRVDVTYLNDPHALVAFDEGNPDGGLNTISTQGGIALKDSLNRPSPTPYYNLIRDPNNPFLVNASILVNNVASFKNDGTDARWIPFDIGGGNIHRFITIKDPLTGHSRLIVGDDEGVFSAVDDKGTFNFGIGTATLPGASRNGNLQITQFYYGASQPSNLAAQVANALFYGQSQDNNGTPASDPNILTNGNLNWTGRDPQGSFGTGQVGDGTGVATDQTGSGTSYRYTWPVTLGVPSDFFQVDLPSDGGGVGRTLGLIQSTSGGNLTGDAQWPNGGGPSGGYGNFAVNPLNSSQILISSAAGRIFSTENQGGFWSEIGNPSTFLGSYAPALAYGAPDPNAPGGVGNLDSFLYAGTLAGKIYVTRTGGGGAGNDWADISSGITGGAVKSIATNPSRGSHEAYAVTEGGVFHVSDSIGAPTWTNITGNLFSLTHTIFGTDAAQTDTLLRNLTSLVVDWRYVIPNDPANPSAGTHPVLYVGGAGGVFRSIDNGASWTRFPDIALNNTPSSPGNGGGIPVTNVTDLDLALGNIDPTTGRANVAGGPNVLLATTAGRGAFAIRLSPIVFVDGANAPRLSPTLPAPAGSDSGTSTTDGVTNVIRPVIEGLSAQSAFGEVVTINLIDMTDPINPVVIGTGTTDAEGHYAVQVNPGVYLADGSTDGLKTIGIQAVDQAGTKGNIATFHFTLDTTAPQTPGAPDLEATSDSPAPGDPGYVAGVTDTDNLTFFKGGTGNTPPTFDIASVEPSTTTIFLLRDGVIVNQVSGPGVAGSAKITDPGPIPDGDHVYTALQTDGAGNSSPLSGSLTVTIDTAAPAAPSLPSLALADDTGNQGDNSTSVTRPHLNGIAEAGATILLYDGSGTLIGQAKVTSNGTYTVQPTAPLPAGLNSLFVRAEDVAGNLSAASPTLNLTIITATPPKPTLGLVITSDSGVQGDNITNVTMPQLTGVGGPNSDLSLRTVLVAAVLDANGNPVLDANGNPVPGQVISDVVIPSSNGAFTITFARNDGQGNYVLPLNDGVYYILAKSFNLAAGNASYSNLLKLTIDTQGPAQQPTLLLNSLDDTGPRGDNATSVRRPRLTGVADPNAAIDIVSVTPDGNGGFTNPVVRTSTTANRQGKYNAQLPFDLSNGTIYLQAIIRDAAGNPGTPSAVMKLTIETAPGDYNADGKADLVTYRPIVSLWINYSAGIQFSGEPNNKSVAFNGDFDGDGKADLVNANPLTDVWTIQLSKTGQKLNLADGQPGLDIPAAGDFNGDGITDIAAYRPTTGQWFIKLTGVSGPKSFIGTNPIPNPTPAIPIPADYNGDGITDLATWATSTRTWVIYNMIPDTTDPNNPTFSPGPAISTIIGAPNLDIPVPADYDGDGKADVAIYRPTIGFWAIRYSGGGTLSTTPTGQSGDIPAPADYDGDGKADRAVYRPGTSQWIIPFSGGGSRIVVVGNGDLDLPVLAPYTYGRATVVPPAPAVASFSKPATASFDLGSQAASFASSSTPAVKAAPAAPASSYAAAAATPQAAPPAQAGDADLTPAQRHHQLLVQKAAARRARTAAILRGLAAKFHKA